jgi:pimeloyl-ACP methyl ester carboxylesterase
MKEFHDIGVSARIKTIKAASSCKSFSRGHKSALRVVLVLAASLTMALAGSGCAMFRISCSKVFVPFTAHAVDEQTGLAVAGAKIYSGEFATRDPMLSDRLICEADTEGNLTGRTSSFIHTDNPYSPQFRERFRRIRVVVTAPGYAPHAIYLGIPEAEGVTVELGDIALKPVVESTQFDAKRLDFTVAGARGFVIIPPTGELGGYHPWLWYAPTFVGGLPGDRHTQYFKPLLDAGFFIAGVEVGESFGSPKGTATYQVFYQYVVETFQLSPKATLLPQSRGGLMLYNWAVEHPESVACVAGIYTVCSFTSYPGVDKAAPAYEMTPEALQAALKGYDPIERLAPLAKAKVPIFHIHGDADTVVPLERNAGELVERYKNLGGTATLKIVPGKGHEEVDEFFTDPDFLNFILEHGTGRAVE